MKIASRFLLLAGALLSAPASAQSYKYGPSEVTLYGTLVSATGETPDGAKVAYPAVELVVPINVEATKGDEGFEPYEKGVMLVQLALDERTMGEFKRFKGHRVTVSGKLFHSDNGHHYTDVLLSVTTVSPAR